MKIKESQLEQVAVIEVQGRVDSTTSGELEKKLLDLFSAGKKDFVVDFIRLTK